MPRLPCAALFLLSLLAGCKGYELNKLPYADDNIKWGEPVNGLKVGIARREYEAEKAPGARGVQYFAVHLMNVGKDELRVLSPVALKGTIPEELAGDESVRVTLSYDTPGGVKQGEFKPVKKPVVQSMEPGRSYTLELRIAPEKFGLTKFEPGQLSAVYANRQESIRYQTMGAEPVTGIWRGEAKSGSIAVGPAEGADAQK